MKTAIRALAFSATVFAASSLYAVVMRPLSIEELSLKADLIVQGVVTNKTCLLDPENRIYTKVGIQVTEVLKGSGGSNVLSVVHGGGAIGNKRQEVSGQVEYGIGEEVVGFFVLNQRGEPVTIGLCQGKFDVWQDKRSGEKFARNIFHGSPLPEHSPPAAARQTAATQPAPTALKLSNLKTQIQQAGK